MQKYPSWVYIQQVWPITDKPKGVLPLITYPGAAIGKPVLGHAHTRESSKETIRGRMQITWIILGSVMNQDESVCQCGVSP